MRKKTFLCQFFSEHVFIFLAVFNQKRKIGVYFKIHFHKIGTLLLHKNITYIKGILFKGAVILFLWFDKLLQHKNYENNCIKNFENNVYKINLPRKTPSIKFKL